MKFKLAFKHNGLCETAYIEADWNNYKQAGASLIQAEFGDAEEPDYFIWGEYNGFCGWWRAGLNATWGAPEFCAADYCDNWTDSSDADPEKEGVPNE